MHHTTFVDRGNDYELNKVVTRYIFSNQ